MSEDTQATTDCGFAASPCSTEFNNMTTEQQLKQTLEAYDELERENAKLQEICIGLENEIAAAHLLQSRLERERTAMRDVIQNIRDLCTTDHESKADFIARVNFILSNA